MGKQRGLGFHRIFIYIFLVSTSCYTCLGAQDVSNVCSEQERISLLKFKQSVKDDSEMLSSWVGKDCCKWERIQCGAVTGNVESLDLRGQFNEGNLLVSKEVSSSLAELGHLQYLDLSGNYFGESRIPEFIGSLKQLRYLNLSHAGFYGIIPPHIGNLSNLKVLDLSSNRRFSDFVLLDLNSDRLMINDVAWTFGLSSLEHLDLSFNDLSRAQNWDMLIYMIPSLKELSLSSCGLSNVDIRPFRNSTKILPNIKYLDLSYNFFKGPLPYFLQNLTSLEFLDLSNFNVGLAWNFAQLLNLIPSLSELHLSSCRLDKTFFTSPHLNFSTLSNIQHLDLSHNSVEGIFPSIFTNMTSLRVLDFSRNMLTSMVPVMPSLLELDLSSNDFREIDHVGIWRRCRLKKLSASFNPFGIDMIELPKNTSECSQYALEMLDLHGSLYGTIPESLGRLTNLRGVDLSRSKLTGPIPESLGRLIFLKVLDLSFNRLTGPIPTFLGNLSTLDLSFNQLNGSIPESLRKIPALTYLYLDSNRLTGPIPTSLGRLSSLRVIMVRSNFLNGTIPVSIGQLAELQSLDFSNNALEGVVSEAHFANLSGLKQLDTSSNTKLTFKLTHKWVPPFQLAYLQLISCNIGNGFPQWIQTQRKLELLDLSNTSISGPLPTWLQEMNIPVLDLSNNNLSGPLTNLPQGGDGFRFQRIYLQNNLFSGAIPSSLCRRTSLFYLDFSSNRLTGEIPKCLGNLDLDVMIFSSNQLSGAFPCSAGCESLSWLKLNDNNFTGEFPRESGKLLRLDVLDLSNNKFFGSIPEWIGENLTSLRVLRLRKNNFIGKIPQSLCKAPSLQILDVAYNNLEGTIPFCLGELKAMVGSNLSYSNYGGPPPRPTHGMDFDDNVIQSIKGRDLDYETWRLVYNLDLSSNKLVGEIPIELTALSLLVGLNLSNNHLSGGIPDRIGSMKELFSLDLSRNELTGTIPQSMGALTFLSHLNLSYNNLSGKIPTGSQLQTLNDPSIYAWNKDLCGPPLTKDCSNREDQTTTPKKKYKAGDERANVLLFFGLDIMCGFATGFWGIVVVLLLKKQWRMKLFMFVEENMDKIHVAVQLRVSKMKRGRQDM